MSTICVDVDDTVANLLPAWLGRYERDSGHSLKPEDITSWSLSDFVLPEFKQKIYEYLNDPSIYDEVYPYDDTQWGIEKLREMGHRVVFATATPNATAGRKLRWLIEHGYLQVEHPEYPYLFHRDYVEVSDKSLLRGDVLIDDGPHNIQDFRGLGILMSRPHNLSFDWPLRVTDWESIVRLFQKWGENIPPGTHPTELKRPQQTRMFREIMEQSYSLHKTKNQDYSPSNLAAVGDLGLVTRCWDKMARIMNLTGFHMEITDSYYDKPVAPKHESLDDSWIDLMTYSVIAQIYRKGKWGR